MGGEWRQLAHLCKGCGCGPWQTLLIAMHPGNSLGWSGVLDCLVCTDIGVVCACMLHMQAIACLHNSCGCPDRLPGTG